MSEGFGAGAWLPPSVRRAQEIEQRAEDREAREAERERLDRAEAAHDRAVAAAVAAAVSRGEDVSVLDAAQGLIGRSVEDVLAGATSELAYRIPKAERGERDYELLDAPEPVIRSRSDGWPESGYSADRLIQQASDNHRWLVAYQARRASRQGRGAEHVAAVRSEPTARLTSRSSHVPPAAGERVYVPPNLGEIVRVATPHGNVGWPS